MSTDAAAAADCVLFNVHAYIGQRRNATTASGTTSSRRKIEVSLCPARPPSPSGLFVHCPDLDDPADFPALPRILRAAEDLFLIRACTDCRPGCVPSVDDSDYFVYRSGTRGGEPSLALLSRPHPSFHDDDVGLLKRGVHYTVAALIATPTVDVFDLHRFHSETGTWSYKQVSVGEPQRRFPLLIPSNCYRLHYHDTSTVIAIGGEGGTMGWVDLWRGVLLCDVLRDEPSLRGVPLPLPLDLVGCDNGLGVELGCPKACRAIAFTKRPCANNDAEGCLKLVHLEADATHVRGGDYSGPPKFIMHNWAIIIWSNTKMTSSWKDWKMDCRVQASDITMDSQIRSELLQSGLLLLPRNNGATAGRALQNLLVSDPALDISAARERVVYLMAREYNLHPSTWALALDMRNKTLLSAAEFATEELPCADPYNSLVASLPSIYMNLETDVPGNPKDAEECTTWKSAEAECDED